MDTYIYKSKNAAMHIILINEIQDYDIYMEQKLPNHPHHDSKYHYKDHITYISCLNIYLYISFKCSLNHL